MLDINLIRTQPEVVRQALRDRNDSVERLDSILALDTQRRDILKENEALRALLPPVLRSMSSARALMRTRRACFRTGARRIGRGWVSGKSWMLSCTT